MYKDRIEYLKRAIKRTYKHYTGERSDGEASIKDVANFFNIPIDETRLDTYSINEIDFKIPSIELKDNLTNTIYKASYTSDAELLNSSGGKVRFNSLTTLTPTHKHESLYYIEEEYPIIERMTFNNGEYDLVFEYEYINDVGIFINNSIKASVRYLKRLKYDGHDVKQLLLSKIYRNRYLNDCDKTFEQQYTYGPNAYIKYNDMQDKYTYNIENRGVVYGINEIEQRDTKYNLRGICFENLNLREDLKNFFPYSMKVEDYTRLNLTDTISAMLFNGRIDNCRHFIEIYKNNSTIHIKYNAIKIDYNNPGNDEIIANQEFDLPLLNTHSISSDEIQTIITTLQSNYSDDEFINLISDELATFGKKIDVRKGLVEEETDILNPKLFINKPFNIISELVNKNTEEYFDLISKQFESATNIDLNKEKGLQKVLKPNDNK